MIADNTLCLSPPPKFWPVALLILYAAWLFPTPEFNAYNKDDACLFYTLASNWIVKGCYTVDICPGADFGQHGTWPPVFPTILGVVIRMTGGSWIAIKLLMVSMGIANVMLLGRLFPSRTSGEWTALLTAISPMYFLFSHTTMTEIPFMFFCTATLIAAQRASTNYGTLCAGTLAAVAFLTRGYAVTFVPAAIVFYCFRTDRAVRHRFTTAVCFVTPILLAMLFWIAYTRSVQSSEHTDWLTARFGNGDHILLKAVHSPLIYLQRIYWWHLRFPSHLCLGVIPFDEAMSNPFYIVLSVILLLLVAIGWLSKVRCNTDLFDWWFVFGIILLLSTRGTSARYWLTYLPLMFYYMLRAITWIVDVLGHKPPTATACLLVLLGLNGIGLAQHLTWPDDLRFANRYWRDIRDASLWLKTHSAEDSVVLVVKGHYQCHVASARCTRELAELPAGGKWSVTNLSQVYLLAPRTDLAEPPFPEYVELMQQPNTLLKNTEHRILWESATTILYELSPSKKNERRKTNDNFSPTWSSVHGQSIDE